MVKEMAEDAIVEGGDAGEQARAEAEARRKRIMEKSKARMEKVSGLQAEADAAEEEGGGSKTSSAARMQAMRRRRFKKGQKAKEEAKEESTAANDTTAAGTSTSAEETTKTDASESSKPADSTAQEKKTPEAKDEPKKVEPKKEEPAAPKVEEAKTTTTTDEAESKTEGEDTAAGTKKKYKGVAKMRREKMLQKKKEEAAKAAEEEAKNPSSENPAVQARRKKRNKQPMLPILMYLLTTFMLFLAGLDIGLQHADESILVNRDFAPDSFSIQKLNPWGAGSSESSDVPIKDLGSDADYSSVVTEESDEFTTTTKEENAVDDPNYVPNIDPLFRVDLDELTRGPGVVNQLGRGAVKVHRMILFVLWELPMQFFALPAQLMSFPPVMCLSALTIRQLFGKLVLGAKLPETVEEDVRNNKEITDVLTMIKNAVKNTVVGLFPTAVSLYEGFQFLKTDMYVMLFGVFVGLLYSTWTISNEVGVPPPVDVASEDVIPEPDPAIMEEVLPVEDATDGIADEL